MSQFSSTQKPMRMVLPVRTRAPTVPAGAENDSSQDTVVTTGDTQDQTDGTDTNTRTSEPRNVREPFGGEGPETPGLDDDAAEVDDESEILTLSKNPADEEVGRSGMEAKKISKKRKVAEIKVFEDERERRLKKRWGRHYRSSSVRTVGGHSPCASDLESPPRFRDND